MDEIAEILKSVSFRVSVLLRCRRHFLQCDDIQNCSKVWEEKSSGLHIHLFNCGICIRHVGQGLWHCSEIDVEWKQSAYTPIDLCVCNCHCLLHPYANELLQQSLESIFNFYVRCFQRSKRRKKSLANLFARVNPLYYVTFTTATLVASFILFRGFNTTDAVNTLSLLSGFLVIFTGVYLLNLSREDPNGHKMLNGHVVDGVPTDGLTGLQTRRSMQTRRSVDAGRASTGSAGYGRGERGVLMHSFEESNVGLEDLTEDSEEDKESRRPSPNGHYSGPHRDFKSEG